MISSERNFNLKVLDLVSITTLSGGVSPSEFVWKKKSKI
jgi:hypothetical protein